MIPSLHYLKLNGTRRLFALIACLSAMVSLYAQDQFSLDPNYHSDYLTKIQCAPGIVAGCNTQNILRLFVTTQSGGGETLHVQDLPFDQIDVLVLLDHNWNAPIYAHISHIQIDPPCTAEGPEVQLHPVTEPIYPPINVQASDGDSIDAVKITWEKGTDAPDSDHYYTILRNGLGIPSNNPVGTARTLIDNTAEEGHTYLYSVYTQSDPEGFLSTATSDQGSAFRVILNASDGEFYNKTKLTWNDLSQFASDIRVERSIPFNDTTREELAILNKYATTFSDVGAISGFKYTYYVTPISESHTFLSGSNTGYSKPSGKISGHVLSSQGAGVPSVNIFVKLVGTLPNGGASLPPGCSATYCTMTDVSGYYEIPDIYYFTGADFKIYPKKGSHAFSPDTLTRTLNENSPVQSFVDFTDLNVITVGGRVTYPEGPGSNVLCGVQGVSILINGKNLGILTEDNGDWSTSLDNEGFYMFSAKLHDHVFEDSTGSTTTTLFIGAGQSDINFENKTLRTLHVIAQGGCGASLGSWVKIQVTAPGSCFDTTYLTDPSGQLTINNLPPRNYSVEVIEINGPNSSTILAQIGIPIDIDLSKLDTMLIITEVESIIITPPDTLYPPGDTIYVPADTMLVHYQDTAITTEMSLRFIYRAPIEVTIDFEDAGAIITACGPILMDQDEDYLLEINVKEALGNCYIDTGTLIIYDEISDMENVGQKIPIKDGIARYLVQPGNPDLADSGLNPHEKYLYIVPKIDFAEVDPFEFWALVTGIKSNTPSFITRTPEIPQLIIHDPPGDNSFATIEKGTTKTTSHTIELGVGGEVGVFANFKIGPSANFFQVKASGGPSLEFEAKIGTDESHNKVLNTTITFLENFSTSSGETFVGNPGDVFIGSAMNQTFALSLELMYDELMCETKLDTVVEMGFTDFATTFIYTEHHVMNSLLPTLETLKGLVDTMDTPGKKEYNRLLSDIMLWKDILAKNAAARDTNAKFEENISISSGADLTKSFTSVDEVERSYTFNHFFETSLKIGAWAEIESPAAYVETDGGVMGTFRLSQKETRDTLNGTTRTTSYTISDNDIGDFFSIDVLEDTFYRVPAFRIVSGTSMCPHEPNTAPRELPDASVFPPIVNNVPPDEAALFVLSITNNSASGETRQYAIKVVSNTNPDGAIVNVAGSDINTFPVQYYFDANQTLELSMIVYKGPLASNYDSIGIMIYSECEYNIWGDGGELTQADTTWLSVNFLSECTNVSMHLPNQGWLVNQASNNILHTAFTGYEIDTAIFQNITLQMKRDGYGYTNEAIIPIDSLNSPFYDYFFDVSGFPDGNYTLRARANCGLEAGYTYSSEVSGIIDRTSLAPFGTPTPFDGFLREGQEVSVTFDKEIDCFNSTPEISLVREDTDVGIPFTTSCFGNKVIFNESLIEQQDLEGVLVTARVHMLQDENGNVQEYPTQWSFLVNVNPVNWDPEILYTSGYEGYNHTVKGLLRNTSLLSKAYSLDPIDDPTIIEYPEWLTPLQPRGTVLPQNDFTVEFAVDPDLTPGIYTGTVTAMVDSLPVSMEVTFELFARPVYWPFDPGQYQYTMTVVAIFSLDNSNTNTSTDTRDMVAAFVDSEVRGVANIEYVPEYNVYRAFLTVYSNIDGGGGAEKVHFRFWHALNGVEYGAKEIVTFTLDDVFGSVTSPVILHPEGFYQVIPLNKGWTWISFNVKTSDMTPKHIFETIMKPISGNIITVKYQNQTTTYNPGNPWSGNLSTLALGKGYLVHLSNFPDTLKVIGFPSEETTSVILEYGWNWIGFPRLTPEPVNDVLENLTPNPGSLLKSQSKFSSYDANLQLWFGNLNDFTPGEGYKLLVSGGTIIFQPSRSDDYQFNPYLYEYNMNVNGFADLNLIGEHDEEELIIGAFIDGECRGIGVLEYVESTGTFMTFMLVSGNVADLGKKIEFRIKNDNTGAEYFTNGQPLTFKADGIIGNIFDPYLFFGTTTSVVNNDQDGYELKQSRPNPTSGITSIPFSLPRSGHVLLRLFDLNGSMVKVIIDAVMNQGDHTIETDLSSLTGGTYYYELQTSDFIGVKKLVKQ